MFTLTAESLAQEKKKQFDDQYEYYERRNQNQQSYQSYNTPIEDQKIQQNGKQKSDKTSYDQYIRNHQYKEQMQDSMYFDSIINHKADCTASARNVQKIRDDYFQKYIKQQQPDSDTANTQEHKHNQNDEKRNTIIAQQEEKFRFDNRNTNAVKGIFNGFCGLHYAAYMGNQSVFELLFPDELLLVTNFDVEIQSLSFSNQINFILPKGSSCLMIALVCNQKHIVNYIINKIIKSQEIQQSQIQAGKTEQNIQFVKQLLGWQNSLNMNNIQVASILNPEWMIDFITNDTVVNCELKQCVQGDVQNLLFNAAYFGRPHVVDAILTLQQNEQYQDMISEMCLQRDSSGLNAIQLCLSVNSNQDLIPNDKDMRTFGTFKEEKQQVFKQVKQVIKNSINYIKKQIQIIQAQKDLEIEKYQNNLKILNKKQMKNQNSFIENVNKNRSSENTHLNQPDLVRNDSQVSKESTQNQDAQLVQSSLEIKQQKYKKIIDNFMSGKSEKEIFGVEWQ